mmetsp:Transcript_2159/g.4982  ORF Transcript_2159/g.4982 Transcript_2159/m.4982 type:complete len:843 (-) Transcript_2159:241-2769(-)
MDGTGGYQGGTGPQRWAAMSSPFPVKRDMLGREAVFQAPHGQSTWQALASPAAGQRDLMQEMSGLQGGDPANRMRRANYQVNPSGSGSGGGGGAGSYPALGTLLRANLGVRVTAPARHSFAGGSSGAANGSTAHSTGVGLDGRALNGSFGSISNSNAAAGQRSADQQAREPPLEASAGSSVVASPSTSSIPRSGAAAGAPRQDSGAASPSAMASASGASTAPRPPPSARPWASERVTLGGTNAGEVIGVYAAPPGTRASLGSYSYTAPPNRHEPPSTDSVLQDRSGLRTGGRSPKRRNSGAQDRVVSAEEMVGGSATTVLTADMPGTALYEGGAAARSASASATMPHSQTSLDPAGSTSRTLTPLSADRFLGNRSQSVDLPARDPASVKGKMMPPAPKMGSPLSVSDRTSFGESEVGSRTFKADAPMGRLPYSPPAVARPGLGQSGPMSGSRSHASTGPGTPSLMSRLSPAETFAELVRGADQQYQREMKWVKDRAASTTRRALSDEVALLRRELEAQGVRHTDALNEQASALRMYAARVAREERTTCQRDIEEVRQMVDSLKRRQARSEAAPEALAIAASHARNALDPGGVSQTDDPQGYITPGTSTTASVHAWQMDAANNMGRHWVEELTRELEAETEARCKQVAEVYARFQLELAESRGRLEGFRSGLEEDIANVDRRLNEQLNTKVSVVDKEVVDLGLRLGEQVRERCDRTAKAVEVEREERGRLSVELRAILDAIWGKLDQAEKKPAETGGPQTYFFKFPGEKGGEDRYKACVGDTDDINTLYDMVREALGDTVRLSQEIREERTVREREDTATKRRCDEMQVQLSSLRKVPATPRR